MNIAQEYAPPHLLAQAKSGDQAAVEALLVRNSGLIRAVVRRFSTQVSAVGADEDDLCQLAAIGLWKAIRQFDLAIGNQFSTYAVPTMIGEIRRYLRDDGPIKVSRTVKAAAAKLQAAKTTLQNRLGRSPTLSELAEATGLAAEEIASQTFTMPQIVRDDGEHDPLDFLADPDSAEEPLLDRLAVSSALAKLSPRAQRLLRLRYVNGLTQQKIAPLFGVSQVQISRLEKKALDKLRSML
ncbi:MAG: sigma-70 family RNA polymerase sigma factor [Clostridia bacterium]|nr:sigma-70 family RNA polymerase sigma factor [Clostridia bacterium]